MTPPPPFGTFPKIHPFFYGNPSLTHVIIIAPHSFMWTPSLGVGGQCFHFKTVHSSARYFFLVVSLNASQEKTIPPELIYPGPFIFFLCPHRKSFSLSFPPVRLSPTKHSTGGTTPPFLSKDHDFASQSVSHRWRKKSLGLCGIITA